MSDLGCERKPTTITLDGVEVTLFDVYTIPTNFVNILGARLTKRINLTIREGNRCSTDLVLSHLRNGIDSFMGAIYGIADGVSTGDLLYDKWLYFTELSDEPSRSVLLNVYLTKNIYPCFCFKGEIVIKDTDNTYRYLNGFKALIEDETTLGKVTYLTTEDSIRISCIRELLYNKDGNPNNIEFCAYRRSLRYYVLYHMCNVFGIDINAVAGENSAPIRVRATITPVINRTEDIPADDPDATAYFYDHPFVEVTHEDVERLADRPVVEDHQDTFDDDIFAEVPHEDVYTADATTAQTYTIAPPDPIIAPVDHLIIESREVAGGLFNNVPLEMLGTIYGIVDSNRERIENEFRRSIFTIFQETLTDRQDIPEIAALLPHFRNHESEAETNN